MNINEMTKIFEDQLTEFQHLLGRLDEVNERLAPRAQAPGSIPPSPPTTPGMNKTYFTSEMSNLFERLNSCTAAFREEMNRLEEFSGTNPKAQPTETAGAISARLR